MGMERKGEMGMEGEGEMEMKMGSRQNGLLVGHNERKTQ